MQWRTGEAACSWLAGALAFPLSMLKSGGKKGEDHGFADEHELFAVI
jgi:hypothetical protein